MDQNRPPSETPFAPVPTPLEWLRDTEMVWRDRTLSALVPLLPDKLATRLEDASDLADESLTELADIDVNTITDHELKPLRIQVGLTFAGFGALSLFLLVLYIKSLHPDLSPVEGIHHYWYPYSLLVSLGVAGMLILGREAMRDRQP